MTFETKEQVLERILTHPKPNCPHCNEEMSLWEVPPVNVGDGLGWGTPYLYICFNDNCSCYKEGWDNMKEN
ncbi:MAG: zinc ribbon domain-containing protein, partial [Desulfobacterales bacterium]|nr:zinc ribbon domain-containing protein [Desulfobacterales bacterium]